MIAKILEYLEARCANINFVIGAFIFIWLAAWLVNGTLGTKLDIASLRDFFLMILGKYGVDSWLNSDKGVKP